MGLLSVCVVGGESEELSLSVLWAGGHGRSCLCCGRGLKGPLLVCVVGGG